MSNEMAYVDEAGFYRALGVAPNAKAPTIRKAYMHLARTLHPDKNGSKEAEQRLQAASEAWAVLKNSELRRVYDREGKAGLDALDGDLYTSDDDASDADDAAMAAFCAWTPSDSAPSATDAVTRPVDAGKADTADEADGASRACWSSTTGTADKADKASAAGTADKTGPPASQTPVEAPPESPREAAGAQVSSGAQPPAVPPAPPAPCAPAASTSAAWSADAKEFEVARQVASAIEQTEARMYMEESYRKVEEAQRAADALRSAVAAERARSAAERGLVDREARAEHDEAMMSRLQELKRDHAGGTPEAGFEFRGLPCSFKVAAFAEKYELSGNPMTELSR